MSQALKATFSGFTKEQRRLGIPKSKCLCRAAVGACAVRAGELGCRGPRRVGRILSSCVRRLPKTGRDMGRPCRFSLQPRQRDTVVRVLEFTRGSRSRHWPWAPAWTWWENQEPFLWSRRLLPLPPLSPAFLAVLDPWLWTEQQVCQWLLWATNEFSLVNVNLQRFGMNGQVLCNLGKERFLELAPDFVGDILWEHLEQMIKGTRVGGASVQPRVRGSNGVGGLKMPLE